MLQLVVQVDEKIDDQIGEVLIVHPRSTLFQRACDLVGVVRPLPKNVLKLIRNSESDRA